MWCCVENWSIFCHYETINQDFRLVLSLWALSSLNRRWSTWPECFIITLDFKTYNISSAVQASHSFEFQKLEQALICAVFRAFRDSPVVSLFLRFSHRKNVDLFMCFLCPKGLKPLFVKWYTLLHIPHYCIVSAGGMKWGIAENYDWCKRNSLCLVLRNLLMTMDLWERDSTTPFRKKNEKKIKSAFQNWSQH